MKTVRTEVAERRLEDIAAYIREDSERAALKTIVRLIGKTREQLASYPGSGKPGRVYGTRELFFSALPYLVVYRANIDTVTVMTIFHTSRNYHH